MRTPLAAIRLCFWAALSLQPLSSLAIDAPENTPECLIKLAETAELQRHCLVNQSKDNECSQYAKTLTNLDKQCSLQGYTEKNIRRAVSAGYQEVDGYPSQSPYHQQRSHDAEKRRLLTINNIRYQHWLDDILPGHQDSFTQLLAEGFDNNECPLAYSQTQDRYIFLGHIIVSKAGEEVIPSKQNLKTTHQQQTHLFFSPMTPEKCFRPGTTNFSHIRAATDDTYHIYNLPKMLIDNIPSVAPSIKRIEKRGSTNTKSAFKLKQGIEVTVEEPTTFLEGKVVKHMCRNMTQCLFIKISINQQYELYKKALSSEQAANTCERYLRASKSGHIDVSKIYDEVCSIAEINNLRTKAKSNFERSTKNLFITKDRITH